MLKWRYATKATIGPLRFVEVHQKPKLEWESKIREEGKRGRHEAKKEKLVFVGGGKWAMLFAMVIAPTQSQPFPSFSVFLRPFCLSLPPFFLRNE